MSSDPENSENDKDAPKPVIRTREIFQAAEIEEPLNEGEASASDGEASPRDGEESPSDGEASANDGDASPGEAGESSNDSETPDADVPPPETLVVENGVDPLAELLAGTSEDDGDDEAELPFNDTPEEILLSRLESLIFVFPEPITVRRLARILSLEGKRVRALVSQLQEQYANRGIRIVEISGGFHFVTNPANADVVRTVTNVKPMKMTRPAIETLAIVAYKQPCTRSEVEEVRRVDCGGTLKFLFEKGLVRVLGRKEEPGRPIIYGTSNAFLELFNLKSLADLPSLREFTELWDEHQSIVDEETPGPPARKEPVSRELFDTTGLPPKGAFGKSTEGAETTEEVTEATEEIETTEAATEEVTEATEETTEATEETTEETAEETTEETAEETTEEQQEEAPAFNDEEEREE